MATKTEYLTNEFAILAWSASVQRANIYRPGTNSSSAATKCFRRSVTDYLATELLPEYKRNIRTETEHYKSIDRLIKFAEEVGMKILNHGHFKYGPAQKLLNLTLKYHWCRGLCGEPPHCPVDRIVISKAGMTGINWTEIRGRSQYKQVIESIRKVAAKEGMSVAQWELKHYKRRW